MQRIAPVLVAAALTGCTNADHASGPPPNCELNDPGAPWLAFSSRRTGTYDLFIARADGNCVRAVTSDAANDGSPSFGPAGKIAYTSDRSGRPAIWIHDLLTSQDWPVLTGSLATGAPALSPDGTKIAFQGTPPGTVSGDIYVVPSAGGDPVAVATSSAIDAGPAWSPDGLSTIYFVSNRDGPYDVYAVAATGGAVQRVTTQAWIDGKPAVSPDGRSLYFARAGGSGRQIVRFDLTTGAPTVVSDHVDSQPALSPTGELLAVRSFRTGQADLFVVSAGDGSGAVQLTDDVASDGDPSFAPTR